MSGPLGYSFKRNDERKGRQKERDAVRKDKIFEVKELYRRRIIQFLGAVVCAETFEEPNSVDDTLKTCNDGWCCGPSSWWNPSV